MNIKLSVEVGVDQHNKVFISKFIWEKNAMQFLNTIEKEAPQCDTLVKSITFRSGFTRTIKHSLNVVGFIIKTCSQVEEIHTLKPAEERLLWLFLVSDELCLEHLQLIATSKKKLEQYSYPNYILKLLSSSKKL